MITVRIGGGLGNQMFQYAFGRALSLRMGDRLQIDPGSLYDTTPRSYEKYRKLDKTRRRFEKYRDYGLSTAFAINPPWNLWARFAKAVPIPYFSAAMNKYYAPMLGELGYWRYVKDEATMRFNPSFLHCSGNTYAEGFWRSEKYFKDQEDAIRKDFTFRHRLEGETAKLGDEIAAVNAVCLHVRRGDNIWNIPGSQKTHIMSPMSYYDRAMALMKEKIGRDMKVYVFSDDPTWCEENMKFDVPYAFVGDEHAGVQDRDHLQLMSLCKHFIIPESTFSWWAAWLSASKDKVIICPDVMFKDKILETKDIIPEGWIRI
jgi:hypothetical protein